MACINTPPRIRRPIDTHPLPRRQVRPSRSNFNMEGTVRDPRSGEPPSQPAFSPLHRELGSVLSASHYIRYFLPIHLPSSVEARCVQFPIVLHIPPRPHFVTRAGQPSLHQCSLAFHSTTFHLSLAVEPTCTPIPQSVLLLSQLHVGALGMARPYAYPFNAC